MKSMMEEMESLHRNHTWELSKLLKGKKAIRCKQILKKKDVSSEESLDISRLGKYPNIIHRKTV